ncbi:hypothetical protein QBC37DRAFT_409056, partial [Rhypophila decipiens]
MTQPMSGFWIPTGCPTWIGGHIWAHCVKPITHRRGQETQRGAILFCVFLQIPSLTKLVFLFLDSIWTLLPRMA